MHDIDRAQLEAEELESGPGFARGDPEIPLHETQELELASRLLEVSDEQELEQFLGDVFHAVGSAAGQFARSDTGQALGAILTDAVGKAMPLVRGAVAGAIGRAARGVPHGDLAQQAASLLGLELEGLSPPDQEFETARQLVRLAGSAYRHAAWAPPGMPPRAAARLAAARAARRYAPGFLRQAGRVAPRYDWRGWQSRRDGYPSGYRSPGGAQAMPGYRRRRRPWRSRPTYWWPSDAWSYGTPYAPAADEPGGYGPNGYDVPAAVSEPPVVVAGPPAVIEPAATGEPSAAAPPAAAGEPPAVAGPATAAAEPASAGELGGGLTTPNRWPPSGGGGGYPRARSGRWERRGHVLIVHGA